ncbi:hypothetical protein HYC85_009518 [Camellia sinensis]|uniref:Uncharacterized protein n=1 Tax=Camellia sinensis TaxID=4442 RepID=A0A7J7HHW6_CAMSI|nr:hypothetical protein HYC85_009518 [Camellia sinensis]
MLRYASDFKEKKFELVVWNLVISSSHSQFNNHLCRVRCSESTSCSLPSISNTLSGLEDLYDCVDDLLLLPHTQQSLAQKFHEKQVDEALDGYLKLLDVCATAKDVFSESKEDVKQLLSILRRKRDASYFGGYLTSRKKAKKVIKNLLKDLKSIENKNMILDLDKDHETVVIFSTLKEVESVTLAVLESFLSYAAGTKIQSKRSGAWSLVSKLMHQKSTVACQAKDTVINEFEKVDAAVHSLISHMPSKSDDNKIVQNQLEKFELSIQDLEGILERLLRRLIKTRVFLLNILNH